VTVLQQKAKCEHSVVAILYSQMSKKITETRMIFEISVYSVSDTVFLPHEKLHGLALLCCS